MEMLSNACREPQALLLAAKATELRDESTGFVGKLGTRAVAEVTYALTPVLAVVELVAKEALGLIFVIFGTLLGGLYDGITGSAPSKDAFASKIQRLGKEMLYSGAYSVGGTLGNLPKLATNLFKEKLNPETKSSTPNFTNTESSQKKSWKQRLGLA